MATMTPTSTGASRRVVLIDLDWQDADLLPELLGLPGVSVRLVASERSEDIGVRLAQMCDLPHTVDLADLTREIFDVALVGERSPRRTQLEGLLLALGTPCMTPQRFVEGAAPALEPPAIEAPAALHAAALESSLGGSVDQLLDQALPGLADPTPLEPREPEPSGRTEVHVTSLADFPSAEDRQRLEAVLASVAQLTGAAGAELLAGRADDLRPIVQLGGNDDLLRSLMDMALRQNQPQVVSPLTGPDVGKAWGAWPFRTTRSRGVLAAAAIDPADGWNRWEGLVEDLRQQWDRADRQLAGPSFPVLPQDPEGWLSAHDFRAGIELAVERNRHDALPFTLYRFEASQAGPFEAFCQRLGGQLRNTDRLHRPKPGVVLVLTVTAPVAFGAVRKRMDALWQDCASAAGTPEAEPLRESHVTLSLPAQAAHFFATADRWLAA